MSEIRAKKCLQKFCKSLSFSGTTQVLKSDTFLVRKSYISEKKIRKFQRLCSQCLMCIPTLAIPMLEIAK